MGLLHQAKRFYVYLRKTLPQNHPDRGVLCNNLGEVLRKLNYFNQARHDFEEALDYCADNLSIYHPFWAVLHSNIALLRLTCGQPKEALGCYRCAALILMRLTEQKVPKNVTYVEQALASIYHGMGCAYVMLRNLKNALHLYHKALAIELRILPRDHPTFTESYHELGNLYIKLKKHTKALEHYEEALRISQLNLLEKDQRCILLHVNIAFLSYYIDRSLSKTLIHCNHALEIINETSLAPSSSVHLEVYQKLATLYFELNLVPLAFQMWERSMVARNHRTMAKSNSIDFTEILTHLDNLSLSQQNSHQSSHYTILNDNGSSSTLSPPQRETIDLCELADRCRATGYITYAVCCYTWLLDNQPASNDPKLDQLHKSRLHNNLAACYQDLNDNEKALSQYQLSLNILTYGVLNQSSLQIAIVHYNIALIHAEFKELHKARKHFHKSLSCFSKQSQDNSSILDIKIYIGLTKIYEQWNDWGMVRNYYQRIVDQLRQDSADISIIAKYETYLQRAMDNIHTGRSFYR